MASTSGNIETSAQRVSTEYKESGSQIVDLCAGMDWQQSTEALVTVPRHPVADRYRALFFARQTAPSTKDLIEMMTTALEEAILRNPN